VERFEPDAERLLYLLSLYTSDDEDRWIKSYALWVLVFHGIVSDVFETYDYAPTVVMWHGAFRVANISMEAERDILRLRNAGLVEKLRLATSKYRYITAYRVSRNGIKYLERVPESVKEPIDRVFRPGGRLVEVVIGKDYRPLLKMPDGRLVDLGFLVAEDVAYKSEAYYLRLE